MTAFKDLVGLILTTFDVCGHEDKIHITTGCGKSFEMLHVQDCCEDVWIESIVGSIKDVLHSVVISAEEVVDSNSGDTWTFYKLDTLKGGLTIRWCGTSNGYYSETVSFKEITE